RGSAAFASASGGSASMVPQWGRRTAALGFEAPLALAMVTERCLAFNRALGKEHLLRTASVRGDAQTQLTLGIESPAVSLAGGRHAAAVIPAEAEHRELTPILDRDRGIVLLARPAAELASAVVAPAPSFAREGHRTAVIPAGRDLLRGGDSRYERRRENRPARATHADLVVPVVTPAVDLVAGGDAAGVMLSCFEAGPARGQEGQSTGNRDGLAPCRLRSVSELAVRVLPPAVRPTIGDQAAGMLIARDQGYEREPSLYSNGLVRGLGASVAELTPGIGAPTVGLPLRRQTTAMVLPQGERDEGQPARDPYRCVRVGRVTIAELAEAVIPPAEGDTARGDAAGVVCSSAQELEATIQYL